MAMEMRHYMWDAAEQYGDEDYERVTEHNWRRYFNAAIRTLILVRPDAGAVAWSLLLVPGSKQSLPEGSMKLLDVTYNMGSDGATPGAIVTPVDRVHLDFSNTLWPAATGSGTIENYSYDANAPRIFYVTPPVYSTASVYIEVVTSQLPAVAPALTVDDDDGIDDIFFEPMVQFMLYKAYSVDDEDTEFQKAQMHLGNFFNLLQVEFKASRALGPEKKE